MTLDGLDLPAALEAPRFHPTPTIWTFEDPDGAGAEPAGADLLTSLGYDVIVQPSGPFFARLNAISIDSITGVMTGVADVRWAWGAAFGPGDGH